MKYVSGLIAENPGAYIRRRTSERLFSWLWLIAVVLAATMAASFFDSRFIYVALIEIFIVFPMAVGPVWISESFSPYTRRMVTPHRVTVSAHGLCIDYETPEGHRPIEREIFAWNSFRRYHDRGKYVILEWTDKHRPALRIPENAYDAGEWQFVARILAQNL